MAARRINLLPPAVAARRRARQRLFAIGAIGVGMVALLAAAYLLQAVRLSGERDRLEAQRARNDDLRARATELESFDRLDKELRSKTGLVDDLTKDEVRWSLLLADVSIVIPPDAWLTNFVGTVNPPATGAAKGPLGTIQMNGVTFTHLDVAKWLSRLSDVEEFTFPYLTLSTKSEIGTTDVVNFNSSVELSDKAFRRNQRGARRVV